MSTTLKRRVRYVYIHTVLCGRTHPTIMIVRYSRFSSTKEIELARSLPTSHVIAVCTIAIIR